MIIELAAAVAVSEPVNINATKQVAAIKGHKSKYTTNILNLALILVCLPFVIHPTDTCEM